jgi:hypothetical protein
MSAWWQSLPVEQQVFYVIALTATLILLLRLGLGLVGIDHVSDVDVHVEHGSGLGVLSVQTIATFFVGFGWVGIVWLRQGHGLVWAILSGIVVGFALMVGTVLFVRALMRLQHSGTLNYQNAVGAVGTVYCPIPPRRANGGQVEVVIQGRTVFADALTESGEPLKTGAKVRVTSLLARTTLLVEPL